MLPDVSFAGRKPGAALVVRILFYLGNRHFSITLENLDLLIEL